MIFTIPAVFLTAGIDFFRIMWYNNYTNIQWGDYVKETDTFYLTEKQLEQIRNAKKKKPIREIVTGLLFVFSTLCGILALFLDRFDVILNGIMGIGILVSIVIMMTSQDKFFPVISDSEKKEISTEEIGRSKF